MSLVVSPNRGAVHPAARATDDPRREIAGGLAIAGVFFGGLVSLALFANVDAAAFAPAEVSVFGGPQAIQSRDGGVVQALYVKEGDAVRRGQLLMEISAQDALERVRSLTARVMAGRAQVARLQAEQVGAAVVQPWPGFESLSSEDRPIAEHALAAEQAELRASIAADSAQRGVLGQRVRGSQEQIIGLERQITSLETQDRLVANQLTSMRALAAKGYAPRLKVDQLEQSAASLQGESGARRADVARLGASISETNAQLANYRSGRLQDIAEKLRAAQDDLRTLEPLLAAARSELNRAQLRSPMDGHVFGLAANTVGGVVAPAEKLMQVVPSSKALMIEAKLAPQDAADVHLGQTAQVRFPAFHQRNMPIIRGKVESLSADSFSDQRTGARYFVAQIRINDSDMAALREARGAAQSLKPGLPADVTITLRKRNALQYIFEPLYQTFGKSLHEH